MCKYKLYNSKSKSIVRFIVILCAISSQMLNLLHKTQYLGGDGKPVGGAVELAGSAVSW